MPAPRCAWLDGRGGRPHMILGCPHTTLVRGWAEDFSDFAGEALEGEWFLQESFLGFGGWWSGEGVLGVAGQVEDFEALAGGEKLLD